MKVIKWLDKHFEEMILIILLSAIVVVMCYQIIRRYVFNSSLSWSEEFCRYAFIWFMFIATSYSVRLRSDLRVDVVVNMLPKTLKTIVNFFDLFASLALYAVLFAYSFPVVAYIKSTGDYSSAMHLPMYFVYASLIVGFGLTVVRYIQRIILEFKELKEKKAEALTEKGGEAQ